jgi:type IX secretion system substrate protein
MTLQNGTKGAVKVAALIIVMFLSAISASASSNSDTIFIQKNSVVRSHRISLYPDANQKVVFFSVRGEEGKVYQLYVFDIEGRLVKQAETRNKQTILVKGIKKGSYFFEVFSDDKRIGNGQIAIR